MNSWNKDVLLAENKMIIEKQNETIVELEKENKVLKKALELMSISFFGNLMCVYFPATKTTILSNTALYDYFIQQAKESLK